MQTRLDDLGRQRAEAIARRQVLRVIRQRLAEVRQQLEHTHSSRDQHIAGVYERVIAKLEAQDREQKGVSHVYLH